MKPVQSEEMQSKFWPKIKRFKTEGEMANALDRITQVVGQQMQNKALVIIYDKEGFSISNGHKEFSRSENINCVALLHKIADKMEEDGKQKDMRNQLGKVTENNISQILNNPSISSPSKIAKIIKVVEYYQKGKQIDLNSDFYER